MIVIYFALQAVTLLLYNPTYFIFITGNYNYIDLKIILSHFIILKLYKNAMNTINITSENGPRCGSYYISICNINYYDNTIAETASIR